jgi:peptide/nickel transport system permease protein
MSAVDVSLGDVESTRHRAHQSALGRSLHSTRARIGMAMLLVVALIALLGPLVAPHTGAEFIDSPYAGPSSVAPLGTDYLGRDVLSRVLLGGRSVLWMSIAATTIAVVAGATIGLVAGYSRSWLDDVLMRTMDVPLAFPQMVLVLLFVSLIGPKLWLIVAFVAIAWMPAVARVTRGATLEVAQREYVECAQALGVSRRTILARDLLPNIATPLCVEFGLRLTWSVALIAGVSFLGFGVQPPTADWGRMINENRAGLTLQPWAVVVPVVCIGVLAVGANLVADGVGRAVAGIDRRGRLT